MLAASTKNDNLSSMPNPVIVSTRETNKQSYKLNEVSIRDAEAS